jgi:hypothetical protein
MAEPRRAEYEDRLYNVGVRISGKQKNLIIDHAKEKGISVSQLIEYAVWDFIRQDKGIPSPGPSQFAKADATDVVRSYLTGETILQPCGKISCVQDIVMFQGMEFCENCNLRIL